MGLTPIIGLAIVSHSVRWRSAMTVDEYLAEAPEPHKSTLVELRETLRRLLPEGEEGLSYGVPAFKVGGKAVAGYAYFKNHCSYFPHSGSVLPEMGDELIGYEWSKGTLHFPTDEPLPPHLVRRLVEVRLEQLGV
jgi:uncharacterized protein YdhG (YjbR/CyaY superfamily)